MKKYYAILFIVFISFSKVALAFDCKLNGTWQKLCPILEKRINQKQTKMKLKEYEAIQFQDYVLANNKSLSNIHNLIDTMPKTTIELIMGIIFRQTDCFEAEKIAIYLNDLIVYFQFKNPAAFDENTSHIIAKNWNQIDYSGESMTWQGQKAKYAKYGITDFKTIDNIKKFFPIESKLPYFKRIYKPQKHSAITQGIDRTKL